MPFTSPIKPWEQDNTSTITVPQLLFAGGVMFGSKALGVSYKQSDTDIAILRSNYDKLALDFVQNDIKGYFNVLPSTGHNTVARIKDEHINIIILEHQHDIDIIQASIDELKTYPTYVTKYKDARVAMYQAILLNNSWVPKPKEPPHGCKRITTASSSNSF